MLKFITENNSFILLMIGMISGTVGFIKWLATRQQEMKEKRYSKYMDLIGIIAGNRPDGNHAKMTEQIAAVWFLLEYKEYKNITYKIFSNTDLDDIGNEVWRSHMKPNIKLLLQEIGESNSKS